MPSELSIEFTDYDVTEVVEAVFEAMLNLPVHRRDVRWFPSGERLTSAVHLVGPWNGTILVECDRDQACRLTGRFLSIDPPGEVNDLVRDFLGELSNMIGGNLKSLLPPGITLSMPSVVNGSDYSLRVCGAEVKMRLAFGCEEGPFWTTVLATRPRSVE